MGCISAKEEVAPPGMGMGLAGRESPLSQLPTAEQSGVMPVADATTHTHTVSPSFCGDALAPSTTLATLPTKAALAADPPVALPTDRQAAVAQRRETLRKQKVAALITNIIHRANADSYKGPAAEGEHTRRNITWLLDAAEHAALDPVIGAAIKEVLAEFHFTSNLSGHGLWEDLQRGASQILARIGSPLGALYVDHRLADRMGAAQLGRFYHMHAAAAEKGVKPSQRLVLPELFARVESALDFGDVAQMAEGVGLHVLLLLAHLLSDLFTATMEQVAASCGCTLSVAPPKGFARSKVKM
jgi:hypothetical protein